MAHDLINDMYTTACQKARQLGGIDLTSNNSATMGVFNACQKYLKTTKLPSDSTKAINAMMDMLNQKPDALSLYNDDYQAFAEDFYETLKSDKNRAENPYNMILVCYHWAVGKQSDEAAKGLSHILEILDSGNDMGASTDFMFSALWAAIAINVGVEP